ncbi:MAG TPA: DUF1549 domain-containing protein, partial [Armatimonadota bacterium]|nr:DUF1549 domain-containing protein [Armatimonadota bacterium]
DILATRKQWWSLQPVRKPALPAVKNRQWSANPVDRFILARLEKQGLKPAGWADRRTLARRVYLTLTGLPPTPEEVQQYLADTSPQAYERMVDRVLASPHYGERWARHWMDVVRFGETHGYEWNYEVRDAWRYRDYLIRAFNQDLPYDQFVREHIAGDLLPNPRWNKDEQIEESVIGTAFYRFGEAGHDVFREIGLDVLDNQIDTLSKAFQATTVSCARCHDHKLDAVSAKDYYALLGVLASSRQVIRTLDAPEVNAKPEARLKELKEQIRGELAERWSVEIASAGRYLRAAQAARDKAPDAAALAEGLDPKRLKAWSAVLEKKDGALENPLQAWMTAASGPAPELGSRWQQLAGRYETESRERAEFNAKHFVPFGDFRSGVCDGWRADGLGLRAGASKSGDFAVASEGEKALSGVFPAGLFTNSLSESLNGSLQSPYVPQNKTWVSLEILGERGSAVREVPDYRQLTDTREIKRAELGWVTLGRAEHDQRIYVELVTKL